MEKIKNMNDTPMMAMIKQRIQQALNPSQIQIQDDSHHHRNHPGAMGGGHYHATITSSAFEGKKPLERHRMVYQALEGLIGKEIHAIQIHAKTPNEE